MLKLKKESDSGCPSCGAEWGHSLVCAAYGVGGKDVTPKESELSVTSKSPPQEVHGSKHSPVTLRVDRDGNKVICVVSRDDGVEVSERIPLYVADKWALDKQEWYLKSVAIRLKQKLDRVPRNGQTNSQPPSGDVSSSSDAGGPAA